MSNQLKSTAAGGVSEKQVLSRRSDKVNLGEKRDVKRKAKRRLKRRLKERRK